MKKQDLKETKLTNREVEVLKALKTLGYEWIARDEDNELYAFVSKPKKRSDYWFGSYCLDFKKAKTSFNFIKWEDEEPTKIDDLLKENN